MNKKTQILINIIIIILAFLWFILDLPQVEPVITILSVTIVLFNIAIPQNKIRIERAFNKSDIEVKNVENTKLTITDIDNSTVKVKNEKQ